MKHNKSRGFVATGNVRSLDELPTNEINMADFLCEHDNYCVLKKTLNKAHCSLDYAKNCQTAKFYRQYGKDPLGIGSMV